MLGDRKVRSDNIQRFCTIPTLIMPSSVLDAKHAAKSSSLAAIIAVVAALVAVVATFGAP